MVPNPTIAQSKLIIDLSKHWGKEENFPLSKIAKTITYVPLETQKECFLPQGSACNILLTRDYFLVISETRPIFVFSRQGKYLWKIGTIGNGPHEIPEISNVLADQQADWVAIKSSMVNKVLIFSMKGKFLREFDLEPGISKIYKGPAGEIVGLKIPTLGSENTQRSLVFYSDQGVVLKKMEIIKNVRDVAGAHAARLLAKVYWIDGRPRITEYPFWEGYELNALGQWSREWEISQPQNPGTDILEVSDLGSYLFINGANPYVHFFIVSKSTGEVTRCSFSIDGTRPDLSGLYNDLDGGLPFLPGSTLDNEMAAVFDASHLIDFAKGEMTTYGGAAPKVHQSFKDMASKLTYEDNSVVAIVTLK
jgi:hypothetical protein